jgi:DNA-binding NtrC family response regulator
MPAVIRCVIIDDDPDWTDLVRRALDRPGLSVTTTSFRDAEAALEHMRFAAPDLVITDLRMPKLDGLTVAREFRTYNSSAPVIIISSNLVTPAELAACGATRFVSKRALNTELAPVVKKLAGHSAPSLVR